MRGESLPVDRNLTALSAYSHGYVRSKADSNSESQLVRERASTRDGFVCCDAREEVERTRKIADFEEAAAG